jgi:hypothetical protein
MFYLSGTPFCDTAETLPHIHCIINLYINIYRIQCHKSVLHELNFIMPVTWQLCIRTKIATWWSLLFGNCKNVII